jgi:hypothetical protein
VEAKGRLMRLDLSRQSFESWKIRSVERLESGLDVCVELI